MYIICILDLIFCCLKWVLIFEKGSDGQSDKILSISMTANISAVLWSCSQFTVLYSNSRCHFVCLDGSLFIFMPSVISLWGFQNDLSSGHRINLLKRELGSYYCLNAYLVHVKYSFIWFFIHLMFRVRNLEHKFGT